jgi:hypothetical protein
MNQSSKKVSKPPRKQVSRPRPKQASRRVNLPSIPASEKAISAPTAISSVQGASRPQIFSQKGSDLRVRIRHREYVTDITGSVAYSNQQYSINPGLPSLFPWLSQLAGLFESYKFNGLKFQYRTESATSQVGKLLMMVDWDVLDPAPASKVAMMQERTKADGPTWVNFDLMCDLPDLLKFGTQRYIRITAAPASSDLKTYDVGMFNIASQGVTNTPVIGELWVEYDVELITPNTSPLASASSLSAKIVSGGTVSNVAIFGSVPVLTGGLGQFAGVTAFGSTLTFNQIGSFLIETSVTGSLSALTTTTGTAAVTAAMPFVSNGTAAAEFSNIISVTAVGQTLVYSSPTGTVTASVTRVALYANSLG